MSAATEVPHGDIDFAAMPKLGDIPAYFARRKPNDVALAFEDRETDWATLDRRANRISNALRAAGCRKGDHIAVASRNCDEMFELFFGAMRAGVIFTPIIHRLAAPEIVAIAHDAEARLLFIGTEQHDRLAAFRSVMTDDRSIIAFESAPPGISRFSDWYAAAGDTPPDTDIAPGDVALQLYTSGTTGKPKGVMLSHDNILKMRRDMVPHDMPWNRWEDGDVNLVAMPNGHIAGTGWCVVGLLSGVRTIILRDFDPAAVLESIEKGGVTRLFLVPTALQVILMMPNARHVDYSNLRYILYGASPIALDLLRECTEVFGCGFCQQYGMTETTGTVVYLPPEDHDPKGTARMRAAGRALPGVKLRIVDASGNSLPTGEIGEVQVLSDSNMKGYWNQPEQTERTINTDGWLSTGDAGYLDEDGYLFIQDRIKDMICSGGENVYPIELESVLSQHPDIDSVAVVGIADVEFGQRLKAIVVKHQNSSLDAAKVRDWLKSRIARHQMPAVIEFRDDLPYTSLGKPDKKALCN